MKPLALNVTPLLSVSEILDHFSATLIPSMVKLYGDLTGKAMDVSHVPGERLLSALLGEIDRVAVPGIKKLLPEENRHGRDCDSVTVSGRHCFGPLGWYLVVELQMEFYYTMALDFLDGLKKKKRTVYPIVRDLLALVLTSGRVPGMLPDEIFDWLCPDEEGAFDEEEDRKAFKKDRNFEISRYTYHIKGLASDEKEQRPLLKAAHARFKRLRRKTLSDDQRTFIRNLLKLASLCMVKQYEEVEFHQTDRDENPVEHSFGVLWGSEDSFCDWYHEAMNDQWGNSGPPRMSIIVTNRKSLMRMRIILRTIVLLQEVWYWHDVLRI
jgi:hypothetical protein